MPRGVRHAPALPYYTDLFYLRGNMIDDRMSTAKRWQERWTSVRAGESGGQSSTHIVRRIGAPNDSPSCFLKSLHSQKDMERRRRMYREVAAYETLVDHKGIPRLVESNVQAFDDLSFKLYLVTDLVNGITLERFVAQRNGAPVPLLEAAACVIELLDILEYCHSNEVVHRDIKPANIVLREGELASPVLVDFGLSFESGMEEEAAEAAQATLLNVELGNRFLRLRELGSQSLHKRDPRSDVACVAGIFFYLLTLEAPVHTGPDPQGAFAHQRAGARRMLSSTANEDTQMRVSRLFDRAFQEAIDARYQSAAELRDAVRSLQSAPHTLNGEELIAHVKARLASSGRARQAEVHGQLRAGTLSVYRVLKELADELGMSLYGLEGHDRFDSVSQAYAIVPGGIKPDREEEIRFTITRVGTEFVFELSSCDGEQIEAARIPVTAALNEVGAELRHRIRSFAIQKVRS